MQLHEYRPAVQLFSIRPYQRDSFDFYPGYHSCQVFLIHQDLQPILSNRHDAQDRVPPAEHFHAFLHDAYLLVLTQVRNSGHRQQRRSWRL